MAIERYLDFTPEIHPDAYVHSAATVIGQVEIGARSSIWPSVVLRGDDGRIVIGEESSIQDGSVAHLTESLSSTVIGNRVTVGHNVTLHGCRVGDETIVGMGSILLDNCMIGRRVIIGAGTVIPMNKQIPDGVLVLGNPYRLVRELTQRDLDFIEFSWQSYVKRGRQYAERDRGVQPVAK